MQVKDIQAKINAKTKPVGSLGQLEKLALQIATLQQTDTPVLKAPHLLVFAGDHGIATAGVSAYPSEVTAQMVHNFLQGGAAINVFCRQHNIRLRVVDSGVNAELPEHPGLYRAKVRKGTRNILEEPAMTSAELDTCFEYGRQLIGKVAATGCNVIGFGEMGIGNTSAASLLMATCCDLPLERCVGRGTGLSDTHYTRKLELLKQAKATHNPDPTDTRAVLATFGGYEIAQLNSAILAAYDQNMVILIDGFIATSAYLMAHALRPEIAANAIFSHQSDEKGHQRLLAYLNAQPLLQLGLRLGEGTGCALAYPLLESAVSFLNEMASFEEASVSKRNP